VVCIIQNVAIFKPIELEGEVDGTPDCDGAKHGLEDVGLIGSQCSAGLVGSQCSAGVTDDWSLTIDQGF
jgi:hypothetical protein